ncbi:MAG TPA: flagellar biosynthesis anti-sigma factor FlgM [Syntrophomonadaceae bacterium]|nr:flagellar biosynthesis anti-sigma factor FlgM [Syntrophomonadaceae bacterium]
MIISKSQVQNIIKTYAKQLDNNQLNKVEGAKRVAKKDDLSISSESIIKQKVMQSLKNSDDIRLDKVEDIKERVSAGTYTISDDEVAEKMIERAIVDKLI